MNYVCPVLLMRRLCLFTFLCFYMMIIKLIFDGVYFILHVLKEFRGGETTEKLYHLLAALETSRFSYFYLMIDNN